LSRTYEIHPKLGVARVGNSPMGFCIGPEQTGGLPIACDANGNAKIQNGKVSHPQKFKDDAGAILRQAAHMPG
jgi:L-lysine 6-oxidase